MFSALSDKTILIIGASKGLGAALARRLACKNNKVILVARNMERLTAICNEIEQTGGMATPITCDISDKNEIDNFFKDHLDLLKKVEVVICNAAYCKTSTITDFDNYEMHLKTNVHGNIQIICNMLKIFLPQKNGRIITISSMSAHTPIPTYRAYALTKSALRYYMRCLGLALRGSGIKTSTVYPGFIDTEMVEQVSQPKVFMYSADRMAKRIIQMVELGFKKIYIPLPLAIIVIFVSVLPDFVYRLITSKYLFGKFIEE